MIRKKCPFCGSKKLSDGKNDFLSNGTIEIPFQFCIDCNREWLCEEQLKAVKNSK